MTNKEVILNAVQFIEGHLKKEITVLEIAQEVCYSLYHFIRLFQSVTSHSPHHYLQHRRLSEAALEVRDSKQTIAAIAYDYQFGSPESFSRAFKRVLQVSPSEVRKGIPLTNLPLLQPITTASILLADRLKQQAPELVLLEERLLVGISFFIQSTEPVNDLTPEWTAFMRETNAIKHALEPKRYYQLQSWSTTQDLNGMYFFIGLEVSKIENIPATCVVKPIPAGHYLKFKHHGVSSKVQYTYQSIYSDFLPDTSYRLDTPLNFEFYGPDYLGPYNENSVSEIYIPVRLD